MPEAFSFNREYDFVRLEGLYRATGRPAHEWDIYILKELIDNALDADESLWRNDLQQPPLLHIHMEYISVPPPQCQQLLVRVRNRVIFPVQQVQDIFATQWYTSRKAFIKGLTRGALGNALKTLLGIPYALHNRVADDWKPDLKPLSICCNGTEYLPRYIVDPIAQTMHLACDTKPCKPRPGTTISVGLDYFVQEIPRTLADIKTLAQQYHICNPHAEFHWSVEIANQIWEEVYQAQPGWVNKFRERAPVRWYSLTDFKDLLGALYRQHRVQEDEQKLPLQTICAYFSDPSQVVADETMITRITRDIGSDYFTTADIESPTAKTLYTALSKYSPPFRSLQLGYIGREHIGTILAEHFRLEGKLQYAVITDADNDPSMPFVIEAAVAYLKEGKRQLWTAINFSPTYNDPFLSRWLPAPVQPDELVLGLRGLLDAYNFREDTPMILFLHLVCPNIEHNEFSKTDINHLPFKKSLGEILDKLLTELRQGQEEEEMQLEQTIFQALNAILSRLTENERFILDQLLEKLRIQLDMDYFMQKALAKSPADRYQTRREFIAALNELSEKIKAAPKNRTCFRCGAANPSSRLYCATCGDDLSNKRASRDTYLVNGRPVLASLSMQRGSIAGRSYRFHQDVSTIGRTNGNDLVLSSRSVSRRHARLWFENGHWHLEDAGSSNGTLVNNVRIHQEVTLNDGDVINFGDEVVVFNVTYGP